MPADEAAPTDGPPQEYCTFQSEIETHYVRDQEGRVLAEYVWEADGTYGLKRKYIYAGDQRIGMVDRQGKVYYYLNDHLGSARVVLRESGLSAVVDKYSRYWSFGADADFTVQTDLPFRYAGKPFDNDGGLRLYYYGARYYDPELGRFLAIDPAAGKYPGLSPYIYCANNPLKYTDPDGRALETVIDAISVGLSAKDFWDDPSWANAGWLALDVVCAAVPVLPAAGAARHANKIRKILGKTDDVAVVTQVTKKAPPANLGKAKPHGGTKHNKAIDDKINSLRKDESVDNIRKNQQQVDVKGSIVGKNRPDIQYDRENIHHSIEFGYNAKRTRTQAARVTANDPNAKVNIVELKK